MKSHYYWAGGSAALTLGVASMLAAQAPTAPGGQREPADLGGKIYERLVLVPRGRGIGQSDGANLTGPIIEKKRLFVLTDIEADGDDSQTMVRLLLYSNVIDIEGLTATTSTFQRNFTAPQSIRKILRAYGRVQRNLLKHARGFPNPQYLLDRVYEGPNVYGMIGVGDGHDSTGSEALIKALQRPDPRPLWVSAWGGANVLAQALYKIRNTLPPAEAQRLYAKLRVYTISDQDDSGAWIRKNFPTIFYIVSPNGIAGGSTWGGMAGAGPDADMDVVSTSWIARNIQQGHGPLGLEYPDIAYGMEGDTPAWLGLIPNGLDDMEHPDWGGWGGRYELYKPGPTVTGTSMGNGAGAKGEPESRPIWTNAFDTLPPAATRGFVAGPTIPLASVTATEPSTAPNPAARATVWRWRTEYQNDFAGRMLWTTKSYAEANHNPIAIINGPDRFTVRSGEVFSLDADGSWDPDGDSISYKWMQYTEAGSYRTPVPTGESTTMYNMHSIIAPTVTSPQTVHFILKVTDKGAPALSSYRRIIVTIVPK